EVSLATGVGKATIDHIVAEFNETEKVAPSKQGHQAPKDFQAEYVDKIYDLINSA
ncbi:14969_t:CDS:1, partial [Dentiscutata heterogama]